MNRGPSGPSVALLSRVAADRRPRARPAGIIPHPQWIQVLASVRPVAQCSSGSRPAPRRPVRPSDRDEWKFFSVLPKTDGRLAAAWWLVLLLRGVLPAGFAIAMGALIAAVQSGSGLARPMSVVGVIFVLLQVLTPIHSALSANLGDRTS